MNRPRTTSLAVTTEPRPDLDARPQIARLVRDFYRDVAMDDLLGPVFADAHVDWPSHISTLVEFWSEQLLGELGYEGTPLRAHAPIHERSPFTSKHYQRWLELFTETVDQHFAGPYAEFAKARAARMARALQRLLGGSP
jgi:hemoglobin